MFLRKENDAKLMFQMLESSLTRKFTVTHKHNSRLNQVVDTVHNDRELISLYL
jgi:hypothetical protein